MPLYFFTKLYYDERIAVRACFLYSVFPSVSLFLPVNDVFLGLFGMLGFLFLFLAIRQVCIKHLLLNYFLSGVSFAIGIFFSISMIVPLIMAIIAYFFMPMKKNKKIVGYIVLVGGLLSIPFLLLLFHFNTFLVFMEITKLQAKRSYIPWVFYDLYDFFIFSGIPMLVFSVMLLKGLIKNILFCHFKQQSEAHFYRSILPFVFYLVLFLLDISGFSRAEVGRIWMPYMPILAIIVAAFLTKEKTLSTKAFSIVIVLQLVQILVMQEFWVTLW